MADDELLKRALACARDTRQLVVREGARHEVPEVVRRLFGNAPCVIIADDNTFAAAGRDVYDALRSARVDRPAHSHGDAVRVLTQESPGQFDPAVLEVFQQVAGKFEAIFREVAD